MEVIYDSEFQSWFALKPRVKNAMAFAEHYHRGQYRDYNKHVPYIVHPVAVATQIWKWGGTEDEVIAGFLHDTVEDTKATEKEIRREFGENVAFMVKYQTDISKPSDGTRKVRVQLDNEHYAKGNTGSKRGKFADTNDNIKDLVEKNPKFAKTYFKEKWSLIHLLYEPALRKEFITVRRNLIDLGNLIKVQYDEIVLEFEGNRLTL